jgi:hypothetical protein
LVDEKGRALRTYEARVTVRGGHEDMLFLGPRVEQMVGSYALYGWPCDGAWTVSGRYGVHGPTSEPRPLKLGSDDLDVVMPETGTVQVQVRLPRPFPHGCLEAAYRHVESGEVVRWPVMDDTTNHRLRVGRYVAAIELPGEVLLDLPPIELGHEQQDVPLALPDSLRVFRITVEDELGNPIPAAAGLIAGTAEHAYHNDAIVGGMLVATARPSVDLTITSHGYVPVRLLGIDGDRRVVLDREE